MPKIIDHQQYREELLLRSFQLFGKHGYAGLTTRELARGLKVSTGTLYHYFSSKEALFEQMIELLMKQDMQVNQEFYRSTADIYQRMAGMAQMFEDNRAQLTMQGRLCFDYCRHLQQEGKDPREFWKRVKPRYQDLVALAFGTEDPTLHEFMGTLIQGLLVRLAWEDEREPNFSAIFAKLGHFVGLSQSTP